MNYRTDKLMIDGHTYTHTHTHTQATTIPEGQNWPRVKIMHFPFPINVVFTLSDGNDYSGFTITTHMIWYDIIYDMIYDMMWCDVMWCDTLYFLSLCLRLYLEILGWGCPGSCSLQMISWSLLLLSRNVLSVSRRGRRDWNPRVFM